MTPRTRRFLSLLAGVVLLAAVAGCAPSTGVPGTGPDGGASGSGGTGVPADAGTDAPVTGSGGATAGTGGSGVGSGGSAAGGRSGTGGSATGGTTGSGGAAGAAGCYITLTPVSPTSFDTLESGPNAKLRVLATVFGNTRAPVWTWTVRFENDPLTDLPTVPFNDPGTVEFPIKQPGRYAITVRADAGLICMRPTQYVTVKPPGSASFVFRVTPPDMPGLVIPSQEWRIAFGPGGPSSTTIPLADGTRISVSTQDTIGRSIPAYVRVNSLASGLTVEGYTARGPVDVLMLPGTTYDVLVVPDGLFAPKLFNTTSDQGSTLQVDEGTTVSGKALNSAGDPVPNTRVVLRTGIRPSTVGLSDGNGDFSLLTRTGSQSAVIAPPAGAGLPEAHVTIPAGSAVDLGTPGTELLMTWSAFTRAPFAVTVKTIDGTGPATGARVRVESAAELPDVGTLEVKQAGGGTLLAVPGSVRIDMDVDPAGLARFPSLPVGSYRVTIVPAAAMADAALTTTQVTLSSAGYAGTVSLARRIMLSGKLLGGSMKSTNGVRVIARDQSTGITAPVATAVAGDAGGYTLSVDPGGATLDRVYQLVADPSVATGLARTVLGTVTVRAANKTASDYTVAAATPFTGTVTGAGRALGGAVVQVFCLSSTCLDATFPIGETVTRSDGTFTVALPLPAPAP